MLVRLELISRGYKKAPERLVGGGGRFFSSVLDPEVEGGNDIVAGYFVFVRIQDLFGKARCQRIYQEQEGGGITSLVDSCNILIFFAVTMCTSPPVSTCLISIKLGSNARIYG